MEQQNISPMSGANIDPDTFRRVWDRVMPDQTYSPLEVEPPAQPSVSEGGSELPPVPVCPAAEGGGEQPSQPESPGLPGEPETPESPLCLGEHSQPYAQRLEELREENRQLQEDLDNQGSQALIEDIARDKLGMVLPGEKVFHLSR